MEEINPSAYYEIRFHGRGGQGTVSAAALLSLAAFDDGFQAQAFPRFGSERRGAPVEAYVKISTAPIRCHNQVYQSDAVVIQDQTLLKSMAVFDGLKPEGFVVLNAEQLPADKPNIHRERWICVPADRISEALFGRPLPNTVLLGALAALTGWIQLVALEQAISHHLASKGELIVKKNIDALQAGYRHAMKAMEDVA